MLNNVIIVGRLTDTPILERSENNKKICTIIIATPRSFKNDNGEYETDLIPVQLVGNLAETTNEYCMKGDLIGIKGRLARLQYNDMQIIAEKVTFLSSNNNINNKTNEEN